ncbi:MinD/ParA family protein [Actinomadura sp. LD22]|uniref:MinD/ParA family protein n=1 Tax=Actinomadura physcomitrii TaxID=2650748 RepID=A0A6I4MN06_9ACTN|nr:MinD/ParA family protein [Actinomadura physcomitrii]MWA07192.1 MinD/ParA family protein [Actinomadura physcomitrii]
MPGALAPGPISGMAPQSVPEPPPVRPSGRDGGPERFATPPGGVPAPQDLVRRNPHGDPMARRLGRGVRRAMGASAAGQVRDLARLTAQIGVPVPSSRRIAVTSIRGGAGKSTITALIAGVLRQYRPDRVLAIDADPGLGSLALRIGVSAPSSVRDLAAARPHTWEETAAHLGRTPEGLFVLPAAPKGALADDLDHATFQHGTGRLGRYFSTTVIDCGGGLVSDLQRGILHGAHAQVFVTPGTPDGALSARAALNWMALNGLGPLLQRTVIALVSHTPNPDADLDRAARLLGSGTLPVTLLPFDRHLAAGIAIAPERISMPAQAAATRLAADVFTRSLSAS